MNGNMQTRSAMVTMGDTEGKIIARVLTYGTIDDYETTFRRGVFTDSLTNKMPSMAWSHDWADVIGIWTGYSETDEGLILEGQLDDFDAVPRARQAWAQLQSGSMSQFSVGFIPSDAEFITKDGKEILEFRAGRLDEVSVVMVGAVPGTELLAMRDGRSGDDSLVSARVEARFSREQREVRAVAVDLDDLTQTLLDVQSGDLTAEEAAKALSVAADVLSDEVDGQVEADVWNALAEAADDGDQEAADTITEWARAEGVEPDDFDTWAKTVDNVLGVDVPDVPSDDTDAGDDAEADAGLDTPEEPADDADADDAEAWLDEAEDMNEDVVDDADIEAALGVVSAL